MSHCDRYIACYNPLGIVEASLHYIDIVELPIPADGVISSEDYFTINFQVPEPVFGSFSAFDIKAVVHPPNSTEVVQLSFTTEERGEDEPCQRFRLEWHTGSKDPTRMTPDQARAKLEVAHTRLTTCFQNAFTPTGWALFEPEEP